MAKDGTVRGGARPRSGPKPSEKTYDAGIIGLPDFPVPDDLSEELVHPLMIFCSKHRKTVQSWKQTRFSLQLISG